jgi:hypothetical protein
MKFYRLTLNEQKALIYPLFVDRYSALADVQIELVKV